MTGTQVKTLMTKPNDDGSLRYFVLSTTTYWGYNNVAETCLFSATRDGGLEKTVSGPLIKSLGDSNLDGLGLMYNLMMINLRYADLYGKQGYTPLTSVLNLGFSRN